METLKIIKNIIIVQQQDHLKICVAKKEKCIKRKLYQETRKYNQIRENILMFIGIIIIKTK